MWQVSELEHARETRRAPRERLRDVRAAYADVRQRAPETAW